MGFSEVPVCFGHPVFMMKITLVITVEILLLRNSFMFVYFQLLESTNLNDLTTRKTRRTISGENGTFFILTQATVHSCNELYKIESTKKS